MHKLRGSFGNAINRLKGLPQGRDVFPLKHLVKEEVWNHKYFDLKGENHLSEVKDVV